MNNNIKNQMFFRDMCTAAGLDNKTGLMRYKHVLQNGVIVFIVINETRFVIEYYTSDNNYIKNNVIAFDQYLAKQIVLGM